LNETAKGEKVILDVYDSLVAMQLKDLKTVRPTKEYSTHPNAAAKKKEQDALDALHGEYMKAFVEREQNLEKGMRQMFFKSLMITVPQVCNKRFRHIVTTRLK